MTFLPVARRVDADTDQIMPRPMPQSMIGALPLVASPIA
jgi:hypothetical protein